MRNRIYNTLTSKYVLIITLLACSLLSFLIGGIAYLLGLIVVLTILWASRFNWSFFGISKPKWLDTVVKAIEYAILIFLVVDICIQPFIEIYFGAIDVSGLDGIKGNLISYIIFILFMWVVAGIGEELVYRGYFMKQIAILLGDTNKSWIISALITAIIFGLAHTYQGISGIITTGLIGFIMGLIFYKNKTNLILTILIHGFYDMIGITLIYLDSERAIVDWIISLLKP